MLRLKLKRSPVMKSICKFNDDNTNIFGPSNKNLSMVLGGKFNILVIAKTRDFRQGLNHVRDFRSEAIIDFLFCRSSIFNRIMQKTNPDCCWSALKFSNNFSHTKTMRDIGITGFSKLPIVFLFGKTIGFFDFR